MTTRLCNRDVSAFGVCNLPDGHEGVHDTTPISPPGRALEHTNFDVLVAMLVVTARSEHRAFADELGEELKRRHADTGAEALREAVGR